MKNKRRGPYNLWIITVSVIILLIFSAGSYKWIDTAKKANVNMDGIKAEILDRLQLYCETENCSTDGVKIGKTTDWLYLNGDLWFKEANELEGEDIELLLQKHSEENIYLKTIKWLTYLFGALHLALGIVLSIKYVRKHYWKKGEKCR